jgi:hypothetical protein
LPLLQIELTISASEEAIRSAMGIFPAVLRKNLVRHRSAKLFSCLVTSEVVIGQESAVIVRFEPVIQVYLVQIRSHDFLGQFVGLSA